MIFRFSGNAFHRELLDEADRARQRAEAGTRHRRRLLDALERDQDRMRDAMTAMIEKSVPPQEPEVKEAS